MLLEAADSFSAVLKSTCLVCHEIIPGRPEHWLDFRICLNVILHESWMFLSIRAQR